VRNLGSVSIEQLRSVGKLLHLAVPNRMIAKLWVTGGNGRALRFDEKYGFVGDGCE
jgi:ABC-type iron transport system FetAB ATPase subunit